MASNVVGDGFAAWLVAIALCAMVSVVLLIVRSERSERSERKCAVSRYTKTKANVGTLWMALALHAPLSPLS